MNIYIHLLNGCPAAFDGKQICYMCHRCEPAYSLEQIRKEQAASVAYRKNMGFEDSHEDKYDYRLMRINGGNDG